MRVLVLATLTMSRFTAFYLTVIAVAPVLASPQAAVAAAVADASTLPYDVACQTRYLYEPSGSIKARRVLKWWANSLSREVEFADLRRVGRDVSAVRLDDYQWDSRVWDKQFNVEPFFYYALRDYGPNGWCLSAAGKELATRTHTPVPIVFADWFLFYTSRQIDLQKRETGAGYYDFLGIKDAKTFEQIRFLDRKVVIKIGDELRAALEAGRSRVTNEPVERQIEWAATYGDGEFGFWQTLDNDDLQHGKNTATGRLAAGEFVEQAREAFIGLPNRLVAVGAFNRDGTRQAVVPPNIATIDKKRAPLHRGHDTQIHPFSCFHCHTNGMLQAVDDWARNRGFKNPNELNAFKFADFLRLKRQYFRSIDAQLERGRLRVETAVKECVGVPFEQIAAEHAAQYYAYLDPRTAKDIAALLGVTEVCLVDALKAFFDSTAKVSVQRLVDRKRLAGLIPLIEGHGIPITYVEQFFGDISCIVGGHK